jgi:hypothetical protein
MDGAEREPGQVMHEAKAAIAAREEAARPLGDRLREAEGRAREARARYNAARAANLGEWQAHFRESGPRSCMVER